VEALNTTTIRRLIPSARHQLPAIALEKVIFIDDKVTIHGSVALKLAATSCELADTGTSKLEFRISDQITPEEKLAARRRTRIQRAGDKNLTLGT
jgi:hypothetical protein